MLARFPVLGLAITAAALAAPVMAEAQTTRTPYRDPAPAIPPETHVLTWEMSPVTCDAGTRIAPAMLAAPEPEQVMVRGSNGPDAVTLGFDLDAEGQPFNITGQINPRHRYQTKDLMPSLRASRFVVDAPRTGCTIRYTPQIRKAAEVPLATLARFGVAQRMRMGKDVWDRLAPGDCRKSPRLARLTRAYPDFRKLTRREGERHWTYVRYDIDSEGVPVNVLTGESSGYAALDAEALQAVTAGRYAGGPRTGCIEAWWSGPATVPAPPAPPKSETGGNPACDIADRWSTAPTLTFPPAYNRRAIEGWAILRYDVAPWGEIGAIEVVEAQPSIEFGEAAVNVMRNARYKPQEGGLTGCVDRVFFRIRADEPDIADGEAEPALR